MVKSDCLIEKFGKLNIWKGRIEVECTDFENRHMPQGISRVRISPLPLKRKSRLKCRFFLFNEGEMRSQPSAKHVAILSERSETNGNLAPSASQNYPNDMNFNEDIFKSKAEKEISRCRPGDWNHARRVVEWVKKLGKGRDYLPLLISAAYIHDIGWRDVLSSDKKITFDELLQFERQANDNSKKFTINFLKKLKYLPKDIKTINRLIHAADEHASNTDDEAIIVDADNLSKLTIDHLKEKYQPSEWLRVYGEFREMFPKRVKTEIGKSHLPYLLNDLKISIEKEFAAKSINL